MMKTFDNAAARDSTITVPVIGMDCLLRDTGEMLIYYGSGLGWLPPWNLPWGRQVTAKLDTDSQLQTATFVPIVSAVFTPTKNRRYRVSFTASLDYSGANDLMHLDLHIAIDKTLDIMSTQGLLESSVITPRLATRSVERVYEEGPSSPFVGNHPTSLTTFYFYDTAFSSGALSLFATDRIIAGETYAAIDDLGPSGNLPS